MVMTKNFWSGERCEYCGAALEERLVEVYRKTKQGYALIRHVPAGVCRGCGTRYYAANVLKLVAELAQHHERARQAIQVPVFSLET